MRLDTGVMQLIIIILIQKDGFLIRKPRRLERLITSVIDKAYTHAHARTQGGRKVKERHVEIGILLLIKWKNKFSIAVRENGAAAECLRCLKSDVYRIHDRGPQLLHELGSSLFDKYRKLFTRYFFLNAAKPFNR